MLCRRGVLPLHPLPRGRGLLTIGLEQGLAEPW